MPIYDLWCRNCGHEEFDKFFHLNDNVGECPMCQYPLERATNCSHFKLKYNPKTDIVDWNGNRSRYWDEYKKQKSEGKDVRIPSEDGDGYKLP